MKKLLILTIIVFSFLIVKLASATQYYIDSSCATPGNGTTTTCNGDADDSWDNLSDATAVLVGGDIATLRGGIASGYDDDGAADLAFTNDGSLTNGPITLERDYDNNWGDAWTSSSQTFTVTFGSNTWGGSASITGLDTDDWIWVDGEDNRVFAYQIASAAGTGGAEFTTYLPYKGNSAGTGIYLNKMTSAPYWGTAAGDFQWNIDGDGDWTISGINVRGTDVNGQIEVDSSRNIKVDNCILLGDNSTAYGVNLTDDVSSIIIRKTKASLETYGVYTSGLDSSGVIKIYDSYILTVNNYAARFATGAMMYIYAYDSVFGTSSPGSGGGIQIGAGTFLRGRNISFPGITANYITFASAGLWGPEFKIEDYNGINANNLQYFNFATVAVAADAPTIVSTTSTVRSGGGDSSLVVASSSTTIDNDSEFLNIQLFEYPIYADTSNKKYEMYFMATASGEFNALPTNTELWIECEYYGAASGAYRRLTKSTDVMAADDGTWDPISVTCQPAQAGILYLRGWYAKPLETGYDNKLFMDIAPVVSTP